MDQFTLQDLGDILRSDPVDPDQAEVSVQTRSVPFGDLGYDSLARLEMMTEVGRRYGVEIPDAALDEMTTPERAVQFINRFLGARPTATTEV